MKKYLFIVFLTLQNIKADEQSAFYQIPTLEIAWSYQKTEQFNDAISCYKKLLSHEPDNTQAYFNLGCCYLALGQFDQAINAFDQTLTYQPSALPALYNIGYTYKTAGKLPEAIEIYQHILAYHDDYEPAQLALGFAYLTYGDFNNGWHQHERYLKKSGKNGDELRELLRTNTIAGKTILLTPEGGLGDTIQFFRYAEKLYTMGAYVIACVQKPLVPLLSHCSYINEIIPSTNIVPPHDARATFMSLPAIFHDTEETFPKNIPYITASSELTAEWHQKLENNNTYKIGICWQADKHNDESRLPIARRGCPLHCFTTLTSLTNIQLYSLQKYDGIEEIATMPSTFPITIFNNLDEQSGPFMDTAALMKNLDLIITVDTAIAHLAGALGCKVWLLLPYATDWRWITNRTDSPWYPTMRIFKQPSPFDWENVLKQVSHALKEEIRK